MKSKGKRYNKEQIIFALRQVEGGRRIDEENASLKKLIADLSLDKPMLQEVISKKL